MKLLSVSILLFSMCMADPFSVMDISRGGMSVQQKKLETIAENIANINTIKTVGGGVYKRKTVKVRTQTETGVPFVAKIEDRESIVQKVYDPTSPQADENGYVYVSDYSLAQEMADMAVVRRVYEANAAVFSSAKQIAQSIINLGK